MGDFKLKLSDIFRYMVLGAVEALLCYLTLNDIVLEKIEKHLSVLPNDAIIELVIGLSAFYLAGYFTQMILQLFCKGNLMGTGLEETALYIKTCPTWILNHNKYPHWIYYSQHPDKVLGIYREILETGGDSDVKTEFLYANNLFQGIALSLVVFSLYIGIEEIDWKIVVLSVATVAFLCLMGYMSMKCQFVLVNKSLMLFVPIAIWLWNGSSYVGAVIGGGVFLCLCIAEQLSRRQIKRIDTLIKYGNKGENESRFTSTLERNGVPTAFVLTRVSDSCFEYYREQLDSIKGQKYPNVKAVVLIDRNSKRHDDFVAVIEEYRKGGFNISHYTSKGTGAASLAYEIRDIFLNYAEVDDVAITLDGDDLFADRHVVSRIMGRMMRTEANICLLTFEFFGDARLNNAKNYPNEIVRSIAKKSTERGRAIKPSRLIRDGKAHLFSTIGWTKCYRKEVILQYQRLWDAHRDELNTYSKYEDFPDIIALLSEGSRICAVGRTSILFRKHSGSVTASVDPENYQVHITHYLKRTVEMCCPENTLCKEAEQVIRYLFIPYKFMQYFNIVKMKTDNPGTAFIGYSPKKFYDHFVKEVYGGDEKAVNDFRLGILKILEDNYRLSQKDRNGYYGKDLPDSLKKEGVTFMDVQKAFGL